MTDAVQRLARDLRAELRANRWVGLCVRVCGQRVAVTWAGALADRERVVLHLWRNGWNMILCGRRFSRGRVGVYILPGVPLVYQLAQTFAGELDGHVDIRRTGVNRSLVATDYGSAAFELSGDRRMVRVDYRETGRPNGDRSFAGWVPVERARDRFFAMVRGAR